MLHNPFEFNDLTLDSEELEQVKKKYTNDTVSHEPSHWTTMEARQKVAECKKDTLRKILLGALLPGTSEKSQSMGKYQRNHGKVPYTQQ